MAQMKSRVAMSVSGVVAAAEMRPVTVQSSPSVERLDFGSKAFINTRNHKDALQTHVEPRGLAFEVSWSKIEYGYPGSLAFDFVWVNAVTNDKEQSATMLTDLKDIGQAKFLVLDQSCSNIQR